jgi:hypothetical protein
VPPLIGGEQRIGLEIGFDESGHKPIPVTASILGSTLTGGQETSGDKHRGHTRRAKHWTSRRGRWLLRSPDSSRLFRIMQGTPLANAVELDAALLQAAITAALAVLCAFLYTRYRKPYFAWWAGAWGLYFLRIAAITSFLLTSHRIWLYWHQVVTGWTALALLYAALVFSQQVRWRSWYLALVLFPPVWSYVAIYRLKHFLWAAGPAVLFLSLATLWTGWVFFRYRQRVASSGATLLTVAFGLWGLHHLDYPFLRARGTWAPWGYYLDILLALAVGAGILLLVLDDLRPPRCRATCSAPVGSRMCSTPCSPGP